MAVNNNLTKKELRKILLEKRLNLSNHLYYELSQNICDQFFMNFHAKLLNTRAIHLFLPIEKNREPNSNFILKILQQRFPKLQVAVPVSNFETGLLQHRLIDAYTEFTKNKYGIPEPQKGQIIASNALDMVLIPLLGFDSKGHRLGYGGGFYDKFLAETRADCIKIGLSLFDNPTHIPQIENTDIPLNYCICPNKIYEF